MTRIRIPANLSMAKLFSVSILRRSGQLISEPENPLQMESQEVHWFFNFCSAQFGGVLLTGVQLTGQRQASKLTLTFQEME